MVAEGTVTMTSLIQTGSMANTLNIALEQSAVVLSTRQLISAHFLMVIINLQ